MPKRILLAEESETIRKIAESLLRQNGFEVLSMTTGAKALEVLQFTAPDLILVAFDMNFKGDTSLFDKLRSDSKTALIPLILLANEEEQNLPLPNDLVIRKPFDPKEFIKKVNLLMGQNQSAAANPFSTSVVEDDFLDAALGLDQIDVTDTEVLGNATTGKIKVSQNSDNMIGFEHKQDITNNSSDSKKIESLMITDDDVTNIKHSHKAKPAPPIEMSGTGKLEILDDQFGVGSQDVDPLANEDADHDYNWFLDELTNDNNENAQQAKSENLNDSDALSFEETSSFVDPVTPAKPVEQASSVDKFIDEFKKEVEKFGSDEPESITIKETKQKLSESGSILQWTDSVEKVSPQQIKLFKKEFVEQLAEKLATKIADKIDANKLLQLINQEISKKTK